MTTLLAFVFVLGVTLDAANGQEEPWDGIWRGPDCSAELQNCMECIAGVESRLGLRGFGPYFGNDLEYCPEGCNRRDMNNEVDDDNPCLCGPYQISEDYFSECSEAEDDETLRQIKDWQICTRDQRCARQCVFNYLKAHREECFGTPHAGEVSCLDHWRLHRNGEDGCTEEAEGEDDLASCCSTPALRCKTEEACLAWMCGLSSNAERFQCGTDFSNDGAYGVYQISAEYFEECSDTLSGYSVPIQDLVECTADVQCATICVQNYLKRYAKYCYGKDAEDLSCVERARLHHGGPDGCLSPSIQTARYVRRVQRSCQAPVGGSGMAVIASMKLSFDLSPP